MDKLRVEQGVHGMHVKKKKYWQIFVDDRPDPSDATAQLKAVFFYAMTVMDKICGWGETRQMGGISICSLYVGPHRMRAVATRNFLKRRMLSIVESGN